LTPTFTTLKLPPPKAKTATSPGRDAVPVGAIPAGPLDPPFANASNPTVDTTTSVSASSPSVDNEPTREVLHQGGNLIGNRNGLLMDRQVLKHEGHSGEFRRRAVNQVNR
jgi:hypothetical protein